MKAATALLALLLAGCAPWQSSAPVTPSSYSVAREAMPRTLGRLRRLAVIELQRRPPSACDSASHGETVAGELSPVVRELLQDRKGYEIVAPDPGADDAAGADVVAALAADMARARHGDEAMQLAAPARDWLAQLRTRRQVDALLVVLVESTCANAIGLLRGSMALSTLGLSEKYRSPDLIRPETLYAAAAFESASGRLVWRHELGRGAVLLDSVRRMGGSGTRPPGLEQLLDPIEPALPKILTR